MDRELRHSILEIKKGRVIEIVDGGKRKANSTENREDTCKAGGPKYICTCYHKNAKNHPKQ